MKYLYAILDIAAEEFPNAGIFVASADAAAVRNFMDAASNPETTVGKHLKDMNLVRLGTLTEMGVEPAISKIVKGDDNKDYIHSNYELVITGEKLALMKASRDIPADANLQLAK